MSYKRRGQLTVSGEWCRHLRGYLKRRFWKAERTAQARDIELQLATLRSRLRVLIPRGWTMNAAESPAEAAWMAERDRALLALDLEWARRQFGAPSHDLWLLVAMHRARLHLVGLPIRAREDSRLWLRVNGFTDVHGLPLPDELPL